MFHIHWVHPINWDGTWSLKRGRKQMGVHFLETLEHCARPSQSTKFWALQNKHSQWVHHCIYRIQTRKKKQGLCDHSRCSTSMSHYSVKLEKKKTTKFHSHTGTKGSRHQKYHSYWMGLSSLQKSDVLEHLEKKKKFLCNKEQKCTRSNGWPALFCFCFYIVQN